MKHIVFSLIMLFVNSGYCLSKLAATQRTQNRIEALIPWFAQMGFTCNMYSDDCEINDTSQEFTLRFILKELAEQPAVINYDSGDENFMIDGAVRFAKTGNRWGSPVIFNKDLFAIKNAVGQFKPIDILPLVGMLIHEFGHHQAQKLASLPLRALRHEELDSLGAKVSQYSSKRTRKMTMSAREIPGLKASDEVFIYISDVEIYNGTRSPWSFVFVDTEVGSDEISLDLAKDLTCPKVYHNGRLYFWGDANWIFMTKVKAPQITLQDDTLVFQQEVQETSVVCSDKKSGEFEVFKGYTGGLLKIAFKRNAAGLFTYDKTMTSFQAKAPADQYNP